MQPTSRRTAGFLAALIAVASCTDGTGLESSGMLRVRPVFAPGEEPSVLGISPRDIRLVLRRGDGGVVSDTTLPYEQGATTSWLLDLASPPESVAVSADIGQGASVLYTGAGVVSVPAGISPGSTHDLLVRYRSNGAFSIDVTPDSARLAAPGETRQFDAVARDAQGEVLTGFSFAWSSTRPQVATVDPASGLVTAVGPGRTMVSATSGNVADTAVLDVGSGIVTAVVIAPDSATVSAGAARRFTARALNAQGDSVPGVVFNWASADITVATVDRGGLASGIAEGQTFITASLGGLTDTALLRVTSGDGNGDVASIVVSPDPAVITSIGGSQQFSAIAFDAQGTPLPNIPFQWSSGESSVAVVTSTGLATGRSAGFTNIMATANGVTGAASLTVRQIAVAIIIIPQAATLTALGDTRQFFALAVDAGGAIIPGVAFSWNSSSPAVATVTSDGGVATAITSGVTTISASTGSLTGSAALTVAQTIHSIDVMPGTVTVTEGEVVPFTAVARDANGHVVSAATFIWSTSNPTVATVTGSGVVTATGGGTAQVTASAGTVTGSGTLTVVVVGSIDLGPVETGVAIGGTKQFVAVVRDTAGNVLNGVRVTWSSLKPGIASIDPVTGLATGHQQGFTQITATAGHVTATVWLLVVSSNDALFSWSQGSTGTRGHGALEPVSREIVHR